MQIAQRREGGRSHQTQTPKCHAKHIRHYHYQKLMCQQVWACNHSELGRICRGSLYREAQPDQDIITYGMMTHRGPGPAWLMWPWPCHAADQNPQTSLPWQQPQGHGAQPAAQVKNSGMRLGAGSGNDASEDDVWLMMRRNSVTHPITATQIHPPNYSHSRRGA